ncbi:MAG: hypothetical protein AAF317_14575, partial [Pseudomonadota bacterium]
MSTITEQNEAITPRPSGYLHGPFVDLICLGGGSLPILIALVMLPPAEYRASVLATVFIASHFINNPHFMHSYQIFYDRFREKTAPGAPLRMRYLIAGIGVPLIMIGYFLWCIVTLNVALMGQAMNVMLFLVGWHYVKQGYGILIVESVLKKAFYNQTEKDWLKWNAFAVWIASWVYGNQLIQESERYGLTFFSLGLPQELLWLTGAVACITTVIAVVLLVRRAARGPLALNGVLAYATSAYVWLVVAR